MSDWKKIEAVLFASGKYLDEQTILDLTYIKKNNLKKALDDLKKHYSNADTSLKLFNDETSWKINVKEEYSDIVKRVVSDAELPRPVMETLALIAYKSPVMQSDIINMRGVGAYDHISYLETKKFITKERYGRTYKLKITEKFNDYFDVDEEKIRTMFKEINPKKPEINLEIYNSEEQFEKNLGDRMKKHEPEKQSDRDEFLNDIDSRIQSVKTNIDASEEEINELTQKNQEDNQDEQNTKEDFINKINEDIDSLVGTKEDSETDQEKTN
ncbi:MAG: SMC-Scp complex subunit ScpB [Candidatus Woesearchaeota archaeon]